MGAQQAQGVEFVDLDGVLKDAHQHLGPDRGGSGGVAAVLDPDAGVIADGAHRFLEILHTQHRQWLQMGAFFLEHGLHLAARAAVDAGGGPLGLPVLEKFVLLFDRLEATALERGALSVADCVLDAALAVGVADSGRIGDHAIVREHGRVHRVELGLVEVGLEHALFEIIEHDVATTTAEIAPGLLMQTRPGFLT